MPDSSGIPDAMPAPQPHHSVAGRIRTYFLTGLIVAGPIAVVAQHAFARLCGHALRRICTVKT